MYWQELIAEIEKELINITMLQKELNNEMKKKKYNRRATGSILHDFYNCCERIFRKISSEINGGFGQNENWHKDLMYRMTIEFKGVRPYVISEDLAAELDDYLSFRHIFRNIYGFELRGERLDRLIKKFDRVSNKFKEVINNDQERIYETSGKRKKRCSEGVY